MVGKFVEGSELCRLFCASLEDNVDRIADNGGFDYGVSEGSLRVNWYFDLVSSGTEEVAVTNKIQKLLQ